MASKRAMLDQAQAFSEYARDVRGVRTALVGESEDGRPAVSVGVDGDVYNDLQSAAYRFGLEPRGKADGLYVFAATHDGVEGATRGPMSRT